MREIVYIPMREKAPAEKDWQKKLYTREQLANWEVIGLPTGDPNRIVVRDYDNLEIAREEYLVRRDLFKCLVRTPNGLHVYLRQPEFHVPNAVKVGGKPIDLRSTGGLVVAEGSTIKGKPYRFIPGHEFRSVDELPVFPADWLPPPKPETYLQGNFEEPDTIQRITRAAAFGACSPTEQTGSQADNRHYSLACKLCRLPPFGFGLSIEQAYPIILSFDQRCEKPLGQARLLRKLHEAKRKDETCSKLS